MIVLRTCNVNGSYVSTKQYILFKMFSWTITFSKAFQPSAVHLFSFVSSDGRWRARFQMRCKLGQRSLSMAGSCRNVSTLPNIRPPACLVRVFSSFVVHFSFFDVASDGICLLCAVDTESRFLLPSIFRYSKEGFVKETLLSLAELLQVKLCPHHAVRLIFIVASVELLLPLSFKFQQCFEGYELACKQAPPQVQSRVLFSPVMSLMIHDAL